MRKYKFFVNYDKEEKWLAEMALKGFMLERISVAYHFSSISPENKTIRIDYRQFGKQEEFVNYLTLFEDSGWRHIAGSRHSGTQYFEKMADTCDDTIFSDAQSKAGRYKRLANMWMTLFIAYLPFLTAMFLTSSFNVQAISNPKALYLTPGLWERDGFSFWFGLLFETPFVLLRNFAWLPVIFCLVLYCILALKSWRLYKKGQRV